MTGTEPPVRQPGPGDPRKWLLVADQVRTRIKSGKLRPGQAAPSITELAREHGYARQTCAKALRMLEAEGLLIRYPGLGYYVAGPGESD